jgi:hypothetical protein
MDWRPVPRTAVTTTIVEFGYFLGHVLAGMECRLGRAFLVAFRAHLLTLMTMIVCVAVVACRQLGEEEA